MPMMAQIPPQSSYPFVSEGFPRDHVSSILKATGDLKRK